MLINSLSRFYAGADPAFPIGGSPALQGAPTYDFVDLSQELHNFLRKFWSGGASLGSATTMC